MRPEVKCNWRKCAFGMSPASTDGYCHAGEPADPDCKGFVTDEEWEEMEEKKKGGGGGGKKTNRQRGGGTWEGAEGGRGGATKKQDLIKQIKQSGRISVTLTSCYMN